MQSLSHAGRYLGRGRNGFAISASLRCRAAANGRWSSARLLTDGRRQLSTTTSLASQTNQQEFKGYGADSGQYVNKEAVKGQPKYTSKPWAVDWSVLDKPSGALFNTPQTASDWQTFRLSDEQVQQYHKDGYISNVKVLSDEQCDRLLADYSLFLDEGKPHDGHGYFYEYHLNQGGDPENVLLHTLGHWRITQLFHDIVFLPNIAVPASQLIDPDNKEECVVRLWHDQLFGKPPKHGGVVAWHQDYSYWNRTAPMKHLTVHIALDEQTEDPDNGCLRFIPGSHHWHRDGKPLPITDDTFGNMESIQSVLTPEEKAAFRHVPSRLKKGEASFHHPLTVHGSFSNRTASARRACVVNYIADGVISETNETLLSGTDPVPKGAEVKGRFFPIVFDPKWSQTTG